jgi:hypothetical protein
MVFGFDFICIHRSAPLAIIRSTSFLRCDPYNLFHRAGVLILIPHSRSSNVDYSDMVSRFSRRWIIS